ncbi:MAG: hypothetical protein AMS20_14245 [Gemmatimonas sp. SG8_28]|nr:MAG: hypothetical protein AMS20_14245 [Gemmatimonas sp. SG8_28]
MTMRGAAVAFAMLAVGSALEAQTLRGRVLDSESGEPVMLAYVGLMAEEGEMVVAALATTEGVFELEAPRRGSYFLYISRTGYETLVDGLFEIGRDGSMDVQVGLRPKPVELDPLVVETDVDKSPLEVAGFYDRALMGRGTFLIREDIERTAVDKITDAFRNIPRLTIDESRPLTGSMAVMQYPAVRIMRNGRECSPTFYLDRHVIALGGDTPVRPDDFVTPAEIEAIEIYTRPSEIPVEFDELTNCGVVLMWTRVR